MGRFHRCRILGGWYYNTIRRDRQKPVCADVFRIRMPCGRAEARPYGKTLHLKVWPGQVDRELDSHHTLFLLRKRFV